MAQKLSGVAHIQGSGFAISWDGEALMVEDLDLEAQQVAYVLCGSHTTVGAYFLSLQEILKNASFEKIPLHFARMVSMPHQRFAHLLSVDAAFMAASEIIADRELAAWSKLLPLASQQLLAHDENERVLNIFSKNEYMHPLVLKELVRHSDQRMRFGIASHPNLSRELALVLANDPSASVRLQVASHSTFQEVFEILLERNDDSLVSMALMKKRLSPAALLHIRALTSDSHLHELIDKCLKENETVSL